jgi:hypothetical protein
MAWRIETFDGVLILTGMRQVADTGRFTIPAGRVDPTRICGDGECELVLWLERVRTGAVDPGFRSGFTSGIQTRAAVFLSTP